MQGIIDVFVDQFNHIMAVSIHDRTWIASQTFAFFALITMFWSFQIKDKLKMMLLLGLGTTFLSISAALLGNWTLTFSFAIASVRNYVFCYFEWRGIKERPVAKKVWYLWAGIFITATLGATVTLVYFGHLIPGLSDPHAYPVNPFAYGVNRHSNWLEWMISLTLVGLIIGNVTPGTDLMRISFVANRTFNIINHWHFVNVIAVFIACMTISSNIIFYIRQLVAWRIRVKKERRAAMVE